MGVMREISPFLIKVAVLTGVTETVKRGCGWMCNPSGSSVSSALNATLACVPALF